MALIDQNVNVDFRGGVDLKTNSRLVIPTKLTLATDVEFQDTDTIATRPGLAERTLAGAFTNAVRMFEHGKVPNIEFNDGSVLRAPSSGTGFGAYGAGALSFEPNTFARVGALTRRAQALLQKPTAPGAGVPLYDRNFDVAVGTTNYIIAWEEPGYTGRMAVRFSVRRLDNDAEIQFGIFSSSGGATDIYVKPRVLYDLSSGSFSIWVAHFLSGGVAWDLEAYSVPEVGGSLTGPTVVIAVPAGGAVEGAVGLEALFDVYYHSTSRVYGVAARQTDAPGTIHMALRDQSFVAVVANTNGAPAVKPVSLAVHVSSSGGVDTVHAIFGASTSIKGYRLPSNTGVQSAEVIITTVAGTLFGRCVVTDLVEGTTLLIAADNFSATTSSFATTYYLSCTTAHAGASRTAISTNCFLAGRIFAMRGRRYVPVIFTSTQFQSVMLVLDLDCAARNFGVTTAAQPLFVARLDWGETANPGPLASDSAHRVPGCVESLMPYLKYEVNTRLAGVTDTTPVAIAFAKFAPLEHLGDLKWNGDTYLAGALPMLTDGVKLVEEGFHWNPEVIGTRTNGMIVLTPVATGTGIYDVPAVGTYVLAFTESWQDSQGNWHESGYATLCSLTSTPGNLGINPTIVRPPTLKQDQSKRVAGYLTGLTLYRTKGSSADATLYLAHSNELATGTGYINDTDIGFGEVLYTEGGVLANTPAPACRQLAAFDQRMVLSGCGDGTRVYWSKQKSDGFAAEFVSDDVAFQQVTKLEVGRAVGSAEMNGKLVVAGEKGFGIIYGTGPNSSGEGRYASMETVSMDVGCLWEAPKSVKLCNEGVWFQSPFGLRLFNGAQLARDGAGKFIGSEVDGLVTFSLRPIVTLAGGSSQQTRFFNGVLAFIWDQTWGQFSVWTRHETVDACLVDGVYFICGSGATPHLQYQNPAVVVDTLNNLRVVGVIQTAPLQFAGIQGFQRVRQMLLLGSSASSSTPTFDVEVAYDGAGITGAPEVNDTLATPTAFGVVQFEHQFFKQKCQALTLKLSFWDAANVGRIRLTNLALGVAVKKGLWKSAEVK